MTMFGPTTIYTGGRGLRASADGKPRWKAGVVQIDWTKVTAVAVDTTLSDDRVVKAGQSYLRYGQVVCRIATSQVDSISISGGPTGGTFTLTVSITADNGQTLQATTAAIPYNATAAQVEAALEALSIVGAGNAVCTGGALPGTPVVCTFNRILGAVTLTHTDSLTGGASPAVAIAVTTAGSNSNLFGPYSAAATDGRQTLVRGECFIIDKTVVTVQDLATDFRAGFDGGRVFLSRVLDVAGAPTRAQLETAFPDITWVLD